MNDLAVLRDKIDEFFNEDELHDLCFEIGIDYENIPGKTKQSKARELVDFCRRHGLTLQLVEHLSKARPKVHWPNEVLQGTETAQESKETIRLILSACYRRAIFTRTHAQLDRNAMFKSIAEAAGVVQSQIMNITSSDLQQIGANIITELDAILRQQKAPVPNLTEIDKSKLRIMKNLSTFADVSGLPFHIPQGRLTEELFFSQEEADREPSVEP